MIRQRTIAISMAAVALTACAHQEFSSSTPTRAETSPLGSYTTSEAEVRKRTLSSYLKGRRAPNEVQRDLRSGPVGLSGPEEATAALVQEAISSRASISLL